MTQEYTWAAHPDLIVLAIKSLVNAVIWLGGIVGTGLIIIGCLLKYIDHQRMKKMNEMANDIKSIAETLTTESRQNEHRLTSLESRVDNIEVTNVEIKRLCEDRRKQGAYA